MNFGRYCTGSFDCAVIVIFQNDYRLLGAVALPCDATLSLVRAAGHVSWPSAKVHRQAIDVTAKLVEASGEQGNSRLPQA